MNFLIALFLWISALYGSSSSNSFALDSKSNYQRIGTVSNHHGSALSVTRRNPRIVVNTEDVIYAPPH